MAKPLVDRKTLRSMWLTLINDPRVYAHPPGPEQTRELRRAFYAGAHSWAQLMLSEMDGGTEPTEEDLEYMTSLHEEIEEFVTLMQMGLA